MEGGFFFEFRNRDSDDLHVVTMNIYHIVLLERGDNIDGFAVTTVNGDMFLMSDAKGEALLQLLRDKDLVTNHER